MPGSTEFSYIQILSSGTVRELAENKEPSRIARCALMDGLLTLETIVCGELVRFYLIKGLQCYISICPDDSILLDC